MKRLLLVPVVLAALCALVWADGEEIVRYHPNTGAILPAQRTPAQVERETLDVEFQPYRYEHAIGISTVKVRAEYWLVNPTPKPLKLKIGFPAPGGALELKQTPVLMDGRPVNWRLYDYDELLKPMRPTMIRALQQWADRHPRAVQLAEEMRQLELQSRRDTHPGRKDQTVERRPYDFAPPRGVDKVRWAELAAKLRTELRKAGQQSPPGGAYTLIYSGKEVVPPDERNDVWVLKSAILATGQRSILPEGRWYVDDTVLDPATGRPTSDPAGTLSMLVFPLELEPNGRHRLEVVYQQTPSEQHDWADQGRVWHFNYILRTTRAWDSFGPIETTIKAPEELAFRSLPRLRCVGTTGGMKTYRGVIGQPARNLQVALATAAGLRPKLKINGHYQGRRAVFINGRAVVAAEIVGHRLPDSVSRKMEQGVVVLSRQEVTVRIRPGAKEMLVNGQPAPLSTPLVVRDGESYLPLEAIQALYPDYDVTLSYHAPSNTVLLGFKQKAAPKAPASAPEDTGGG